MSIDLNGLSAKELDALIASAAHRAMSLPTPSSSDNSKE